jgi:hypothetical protein
MTVRPARIRWGYRAAAPGQDHASPVSGTDRESDSESPGCRGKGGSVSTKTLWTHGNALVVEDPGEYSSIRHRGWGTELNFNQPDENDDAYRVCHIPLPAPATIDGVAPTLVKIFILFETSLDLIIGRIDLWDGNNPVAQFSNHGEFEPAAGLWVGTGSHLTLDRNNQLPLPQPHDVSTGIGISLLCMLFSVPGLQLNVAAVGGEFVVPNPTLRVPQKRAKKVGH